MTMYFIRRLIFAVPLLLVISALAFALVHLAPGGPFDRERAPASPEIERNLKAAYHLDEPVWKQYLRFFGLVWQKDAAGHWHHEPASFNISYKYRSHRVSDIIAQALPVSMTLGALAFGFAMGVGLPLGFFTAARRGRWQDYAGSFLAILAVCVPAFVVAPLLILVFAIKLHWLPVALWESPWHMILPAIALGLFFAGKIARLFREGMLNAMQSEFVTAARAKGLGENIAAAQTRRPHRHVAGRFLFRPDARRFAHRLVHHRKHFPDSRHRRVFHQQLAELAITPWPWAWRCFTRCCSSR